MAWLIALVAAGAAVLVAWRARPGSPREDPAAGLATELAYLRQRIEAGGQIFGQRLEGIEARMTQTQTANADLARDIFDTLGTVRSATESVAEQAKEFTALSDMLKPPRARGAIGEAMLEELLRQVLPPQAYEIQHRFASGPVVDAVVR